MSAASKKLFQAARSLVLSASNRSVLAAGMYIH